MSSDRATPPYPEKLTIALLGKRIQLKNTIGNMILNSTSIFVSNKDTLDMGESNSYIVFNTPNFFDESCQNLDQKMIDFMAISHPGPNLFILAIDPENTAEERVVSQITQLQDLFGDKVTTHLVVMVPDIESFQSLGHLKERFKIPLVIPNENLVTECRKWCPRRRPFLYNYKHYSEDVVIRRQKAFNNMRLEFNDNKNHCDLPEQTSRGLAHCTANLCSIATFKYVKIS